MTRGFMFYTKKDARRFDALTPIASPYDLWRPRRYIRGGGTELRVTEGRSAQPGRVAPRGVGSDSRGRLARVFRTTSMDRAYGLARLLLTLWKSRLELNKLFRLFIFF